jgi:hypothetical protein
MIPKFEIQFSFLELVSTFSSAVQQIESSNTYCQSIKNIKNWHSPDDESGGYIL